MSNRETVASMAPTAAPDETMPDYPKREFSKGAIRQAGRLLREDLAYTEEAVHAFRVAHNWRMAHAYPLVRERIRLSRLSEGLTAGRIKRMDSIRKKLRRSSIGLEEMQDLAGIRAIMPDVASVRRVVSAYRTGRDAGDVRRIDDYISSPKRGGYRSVHLIKTFAEGGQGEGYRGQRVEIQVRTRLQHVWATAVEAVGAMRGEDLKAGSGDPRWLRLLELMSGHFAMVEGQPLGPDMPEEQDRKEELRVLDGELSAVAGLALYRTAVHGVRPGGGKNFLIRLDAARGEVTVVPQQWLFEGSEAYFHAPPSGERNQVVLVTVDDAEALRRAYPNYFLDVGEFLTHLRDAMGTRSYIDRLPTDFLSRFRGR